MSRIQYMLVSTMQNPPVTFSRKFLGGFLYLIRARMAKEIIATLDVHERKQLKKLDGIIRAGIGTFLQVGKALLEIQQNKLYRESGTFEKFVEATYDLSRRRAYQLIEAAEVEADLCTIGTQNEHLNERQLRELAQVPEGMARAVLDKAVESNDGKVPPAAAIAKVRREMFSEPDAITIEGTSKPSKVEETKPEQVNCPHCKGTGKVDKASKVAKALSNSEIRSQIDLVIKHYQHNPTNDEWSHPTAKAGDKERKKILDRIKEGYSVEELCHAIDGNHLSPFHAGLNDNGTKYHKLIVIFRDADQVATFIETRNNPPSAMNEKERRNRFASDQFVNDSSITGMF